MNSETYVRIVNNADDPAYNGEVGIVENTSHNVQQPDGETLPELWYVVFGDGDAIWVLPHECEIVTLPVATFTDDDGYEYFSVDTEALTPLQRVLEVARILKKAEQPEDHPTNQDGDSGQG